jgi:hypothetical protein
VDNLKTHVEGATYPRSLGSAFYVSAGFLLSPYVDIWTLTIRLITQVVYIS